MRRIALAALLLSLAAVPPAAAITYGEPDGDAHPYVGMLLGYDSRPEDPGWFSCTGTLLGRRVVLTAGHCTAGVGSGDMWVSFDERPSLEGFPRTADFSDEEALVAARRAFMDAHPAFTSGTSTPHTSYSDFAEFPLTFDVGVVVLDADAPVDTFGELAPLGTVETLVAAARNPNDALVETVGYGIQAIQPSPMSEDWRYRSTSRIVQLKSDVSRAFNLHTLNNPSAVGGVGGSCSGDSGGPVLVPGSNQIVAVVSWGNSGTCHGADYSWRVDTSVSQDFVLPYLD